MRQQAGDKSPLGAYLKLRGLKNMTSVEYPISSRRAFPVMALPLLLALLIFIGTPEACKAVPHPANSDPNRPFRDKWALIVGISDFQSKQIPGLKYSVKDAKDFREYLIKEANFAPDHVRILLDEDASRRRVLSELGSKFLARVAKPDDLVVLYFSTHGSARQADIRGKNFVVAYDSDPEDLFTTGIEMDSILDSVNSRILSERILLVLDACHSGSVLANAKGLGRVGNFDPEELSQGSGQLVISSSAPDQQSFESKRYENGVFTRKLLEGLRMNGRRTTLSDAFPFVEKSVSAEVQEDYAVRQTPVLKSKWNGNDLMLAAAATAPQSVPPTVKEILEPDSIERSPTKTVKIASAVTVVPNIPTAGKVQSSIQRPNQGSALQLGTTLLNRGDFASAVDVLTKASKANSGNADIHFALANALVKLNRTSEAVKEYRECFRLNPNGKRADYCLQIISYYSTAGRTTAATRSGITAASSGTALSISQSSNRLLPSSHSDSLQAPPAADLARIRSSLPTIKSCSRERPYLSDIMNWSRNERASYQNDALDRVERARLKLKDAEELMRKADSMTYSLVPSAKNYGESEEQFALRKAGGRASAEQLLQPFRSEIDLRSRILSEEEAILSSCQTAARELYSNYGYSGGYSGGTTNKSTCH
ncbi:MAG: caspase family protein [Candidatus Obscuribacterales bacterium]|nr:caspase family protein [Candidatus Obscuribacterales bacterium]